MFSMKLVLPKAVQESVGCPVCGSRFQCRPLKKPGWYNLTCSKDGCDFAKTIKRTKQMRNAA